MVTDNPDSHVARHDPSHPDYLVNDYAPLPAELAARVPAIEAAHGEPIEHWFRLTVLRTVDTDHDAVMKKSTQRVPFRHRHDPLGYKRLVERTELSAWLASQHGFAPDDADLVASYARGVLTNTSIQRSSDIWAREAAAKKPGRPTPTSASAPAATERAGAAPAAVDTGGYELDFGDYRPGSAAGLSEERAARLDSDWRPPLKAVAPTHRAGTEPDLVTQVLLDHDDTAGRSTQAWLDLAVARFQEAEHRAQAMHRMAEADLDEWAARTADVVSHLAADGLDETLAFAVARYVKNTVFTDKTKKPGDTHVQSAYHIDPRTGNVGICRAYRDWCRFGGWAAHFKTEAEANTTVAVELSRLRNHTQHYGGPQEEGWFTVRLIEPDGRDASDALRKAQAGHRIVIGPGFMVEKTDQRSVLGQEQWKILIGEQWEVDEGNVVYGGGRPTNLPPFPQSGRMMDDDSVRMHLKAHGGRVESAAGRAPYRIEWRGSIGAT